MTKSVKVPPWSDSSSHRGIRPAVLAALLTSCAAPVLSGPATPSSRALVVVEKPHLEARPATHYVAISETVSMRDLPTVLPRDLPQVFGWLQTHHVMQAGPPLIRYNVIQMPGRLEIEVGLPVAEPVHAEGHIHGGTLPAGRYAVLVHSGPYSELEKVTGSLLEWAHRNHVRWKMRYVGGVPTWGARVEFYPTDPKKQPDPRQWKTELAFLTKK